MNRRSTWLGLLGGLVVALPVHAADVAATLEADGRFDVFAQALRQASEARAQRDEPLTVFAPSDEAFERLPRAFREALLAKNNAEALERVVGLHLVPDGPFRSTNIPVELTSASGVRIAVTYTRGALTLRPTPGEQTRDPEDVLAARAVNEARIVTGDIVADDALIHILDAVLLPPDIGDLSAPTADPDPATDPRSAEAAARPSRANEFVADIAEADADGSAQIVLPTDQTPPEAEGEVTVLPSQIAGTNEREDIGAVVTLPPDPAVSQTEADEASADNVVVVAAEPDGDMTQDAPEADGAGTANVTIVPPEEDEGARRRPPADMDDESTVGTGVAADPEVDALKLTRSLVSVSDILGQDVKDRNGETVGEIEDVLISLETGVAETVVLSIDGGLLDLFGETVSVETSAISIDPLGGTVVVDRNALNLDSE